MYGDYAALIHHQAAIPVHLAAGHYGENPLGIDYGVDLLGRRHSAPVMGKQGGKYTHFAQRVQWVGFSG